MNALRDPLDEFADLYAPPPLTQEQWKAYAEQYQRDAIASAQSEDVQRDFEQEYSK